MPQIHNLSTLLLLRLKDLSGKALVETWRVWVNRQSIHFALLSCPSCFHGILTMDKLTKLVPKGVFRYKNARHNLNMTRQKSGISRPQSCEAGRLFSRTFLPIPGTHKVFSHEIWQRGGREREREREEKNTAWQCLVQPSPYASCCQAALISVASLTMLHMPLRLPKLTIQTLPQQSWQRTMANWELADSQDPMCKFHRYHCVLWDWTRSPHVPLVSFHHHSQTLQPLSDSLKISDCRRLDWSSWRWSRSCVNSDAWILLAAVSDMDWHGLFVSCLCSL